MKKIATFLTSAAILTTAIACNPAPETSTTAPTPTEEQTTEEQAEDGELQNPGDTATNEAGKATLVKIARPEETIETGPMKMTVKTINIVDWEPSDQLKPVIQKEGTVTMISVSAIVENTSEDTISFHPNQAQIVAGKEQTQANLIMSEQVGGEFIGQIEKKGKIIFILDTPAQDIETVKMVINAPNNESLQSVGDKVTLEYEL
ncbi:MAG: hypothetical protein AAGA60_19890 [Cyanobacteria bacterium P01_E01_bin.42]